GRIGGTAERQPHGDARTGTAGRPVRLRPYALPPQARHSGGVAVQLRRPQRPDRALPRTPRPAEARARLQHGGDADDAYATRPADRPPLQPAARFRSTLLPRDRRLAGTQETLKKERMANGGGRRCQLADAMELTGQLSNREFQA